MKSIHITLIYLFSIGLICSGCDTETETSAETASDMAPDVGAEPDATSDDPYQLGGTYHDYRSCDEAEVRNEEPTNGDPMDEEPADGNPPSPGEMADANMLASELPAGNGESLENGEYFIRINLVELDFVLDLQLEVDGMASDAGGVLGAMRLRAISEDAISEPFAEATDIVVGRDGQFTAEFGDATLPRDFSPTGSPVLFNLNFIGVVSSSSSTCGFVVGQIQTLGLALERSTFSAIPWADRTDDAPVDCEDSDRNVECQRLVPDECPELVAGDNTIISCGLERRVRVRLPSTFDMTQEPYKTVVLFHGLNEEQVDDIEEDTALDRLVDPFDFIVLSPYSRNLPIAWDQASPGDNADVALFDDLLTCAQAQLNADPDRLYAMGDSAGGMFVTFLVSQFASQVAAAAINSGGTIFELPNLSERKVPVIFGWGGMCDVNVGQDFGLLSRTAIDGLVEHGHLVAACNHDSGHEWKPLFSPWFLEFIFAHRRSDDTSPFAQGLPETMPEYCELRMGD